MSPPRDDRDTYRPKTPPAGVRAQTAAPTVELDDDPTGQHELGRIDEEQLAELRSKRPTDERVAKLEAKNDELQRKLLELVTVKVTASVEVEKAAATADIEETREDRKAARDFKVKLGAVIVTGLTAITAGLVALLHGCS